MASISDITLVAQVATFGSERAFAKLVERHQEAVRQTLRSLCEGDTMLADDLAQETFIKAWQGIATFRAMSGFRTWLISIAYHVFLDNRRAASHNALTDATDISDMQHGGMPNTATPDTSTMLSHDIDRAMATLNPTERTCIILQCMQGLPINEIATITDLPPNTVKSHLLRAKRKLVTFLTQNGY